MNMVSKLTLCKRSDRIILRSLFSTDFSLLLYWRSIKDNAQWFNTKDITYQTHVKWIQNYYNSDNDYVFIIETAETFIPLGMISVYNVDRIKREAEFGRLLLAHPDYRGMGIGKEATLMLMDMVFDKLDLRRLYLEVHVDNVVAHNLYLSCGFKDIDERDGNYIMEYINDR